MPEATRGGVFHGADEGKGMFKGERHAEQVGFALMRIFFVTGGESGDTFQQHVPGHGIGEEFFLLRVRTRDFDHYSLRAATNFKESGYGLCWLKRARGIVVGKRGEQRFNFGEAGGEAFHQ